VVEERHNRRGEPDERGRSKAELAPREQRQNEQEHERDRDPERRRRRVFLVPPRDHFGDRFDRGENDQSVEDAGANERPVPLHGPNRSAGVSRARRPRGRNSVVLTDDSAR
jgi:hypothetical protein